MSRLVSIGVPLLACLFGFACGGSDPSPDPDPVPDGAAPEAGPVDASVDHAVEAAAPDATVPEPPSTVLSTAEALKDIAVLDGKLFLLMSAPSLVDTCDAAACTTRTSRIDAGHMPPERAHDPAHNGPSYYLNARIEAMALGSADGVVIAQEGNSPCINDCVANPAPNPAVYAVGPGASAAPDYLWRLTFAEFTKASDGTVIQGARGNALWALNGRSNEGFSTHSMTLLWLTPSVSNDHIVVAASRVDTRSYDGTPVTGALLAGAHRSGAPLLTRSGAATQLLAVDTASATNGSTDTPTGLVDATWLATTASLRFVRNAQTTNAAELVQSAKGTTMSKVVTLPGLSSDSVVLGTELGLLWFTPLGSADLDAGVGGPLTFSFCSDAALVAGACTPKVFPLELDELTRVKDDGDHLYALGKRSGKNVVVRFTP